MRKTLHENRTDGSARLAALKARALILALAVALLAGSPATAGDLYRCSAKDVVTTEDDGTIGRFKNDFWRDHWTGFFIDTDTGALRKKGGTAEKWTVVQEGGGSNDFVASPRPGVISASTNLIRVRAWPGKPAVTFIVFALSMMVTGTCEAVR